MKLSTCLNCMYWETAAGSSGRCHRFPPSIPVQARASPEHHINDDCPRTGQYDWCGEFRAGIDGIPDEEQ